MNDSAILGSGKLSSLLAKFAVPCIFSLIISCLYNIADQIFVGQGIGYEANAATVSFSPSPSLAGESPCFSETAAPQCFP